MRIFKKIGIKSFAKFNALYMGLLGLIMGLAIGLPTLIMGQNANTFGEESLAANFGGGFGWAVLIGAPLLYALMGLLVGFIGGAIINLVLKLSGGIKVEIVDEVLGEVKTSEAPTAEASN